MQIISSFVLILSSNLCSMSNISRNGQIYSKQREQYIDAIDWFDGNERLIWIDTDNKISVSSNISYDNTFLPSQTYLLDGLYDGMHLDNINDKIYLIDSKSQLYVRIFYYDLKTKDIMDVYHCKTKKCKDVFSFCTDPNSNIMYFATSYGLFYFDPTTDYTDEFSLNYHHSSDSIHKLAIYDKYLYVCVSGSDILRLTLSSIHNVNTNISNFVDVLIDHKSLKNSEITPLYAITPCIHIFPTPVIYN
eukprot:28950_1